MASIGSFAIYAAMFAAWVGIALNFTAGRTGSPRYLQAGRFAAFGTSGFVFLASSVLMHALVSHDFSIQYVASFSDETMPLFYLIGAMWGGQAGSLLFWTSIVAVCMCACLYINRNRHKDFMPWVTLTCLAVMVALLMILSFVSNPFDGFSIIDAPAAGKGLNPLLQTPKMVIHPPSLLTGLASMTIPFGFAIAALVTKNFSNSWVKEARNWILIPWFFLSIGNMLGGMWAYEELGWGGYWAWDPVENAAFMPWLMVTALIHSLMIQERRGMLKRWNIFLMIGAYVLTVFGTYITRSGLIESVHTFAQSDIGNYFLAFLLFFTIASFGLFLWRWPKMKAADRLDSPVSKEAAFIFNNWLLLGMLGVVFFGTMWPRIKEGFFGQEVSLGPAWFNRWMAPMGLLLLLLMGVGTAISWRKASWKNFKRNFVIPIVATIVIAPSLLAAYWYGRGVDLGVTPTPNDATYAIAAVVLITFVSSTIVEQFWRGISARMRMHGENIFEAAGRLTMKQRRRYGGYIIHLGILCAFLAFSGNALKLEQDVSVKKGESFEVGDYTLTYKGLTERNDPEKLVVMARVDAYRDGEKVWEMYPGKAKFYASPNAPTSEIDIKSTALEDLYVALVNFDPRGNQAAFKVFVAPFTWWFWFGGVILIFGTMIAMWPTRESIASLRYGSGTLAKIAVVGIILVTSSLPLVLAAVETYTPWGSAQRWQIEHAALTGDAEPSTAPPKARGDS